MSPPPKGRLISHFENQPTSSHGKAWSDLWDSGDSGLWDRGIPSPALIKLLEEYASTLLTPIQAELNGRRKKALVPGCGRGYDVLALALHGFDAYGLEISKTAVDEAGKLAERELGRVPSQNAYFGEKYRTRSEDTINDGNSQRGETRFIQGDYFENDWIKELEFGLETDAQEGKGGFDLIYDYTFLCALHPTQRPQWASRMAELLKPGGMLVCLEFPMYKDPSLPGPPWGVNGVHWEILAGGDEGTGLFKRQVYVKPERTFEVGKGTDWISIWERKSD